MLSSSSLCSVIYLSNSSHNELRRALSIKYAVLCTATAWAGAGSRVYMLAALHVLYIPGSTSYTGCTTTRHRLTRPTHA